MVATPYFTTVEFRADMPDMADEAKHPDDRVSLARDAVEALIEERCGTSFVARTVTETIDGDFEYALPLPIPYVQSVTSVTENGVLTTGYTYTARGGVLRRFFAGSFYPTPFSYGKANIVVVCEAGYSAAPPNDLKLASMLATRDRVLMLAERSGKPSDRATSITNEFGNIALAVADAEERPTGNPDVDAVVMRWASQVRNFGFA